MYHLLRHYLMPYIRPYKSRVIFTILLSFVLAFIGGAQVKLIRPIFDQGLSPESSERDVWMLAGTLLLLGIINFPCRFFHFYWIRYICEKATCQVRIDIFNKIQKLPTSFLSNQKQGDLLSHMTQDSLMFSQGFRAIIDLIREPTKALVYLGMAFYSDWQLTILIFIVAPIWILIFSISGKKVRHNQKKVQDQFGKLIHDISEGLSAHKIIKAFNLQKFVTKRFAKSQDDLFVSQMDTTIVEEIAHPMVELVGFLVFSLIIGFAHYRITSNAMSVGDFIAFIAAIALFMDPIRKFSQANVKLGQARAASDRIFHLLNFEEEPNEGNVKSFIFKDKIEIKNLDFSYDDDPILRNLNLTIEKGSKVAFVGLSGSGKSTLINILLGLYPVATGAIKIDGINIQEIELSSLRKVFGLVSQDIFLFHDSIKENLLLGEEIDDDILAKALEVSCSSDFIARLKDGVDTIIGDRGMKLSGGQRQRVTIARAFLQNPDILLFDEATSALDNDSEKVVQQALSQIGGSKTVVAVAHRLSTIQDYDKIFVMSNGEIIEEGTHSELMSLNGEYSRLYQLTLK